jgi:hypothetical protein
MDTTSHNFTWQTFEFGQHSSSVLYDVAIINENNIWAVGEIYMNDSLGQPDPYAYNVAHWDGSKWGLLRVMFYAGCSNPTVMVPYPASSVIVFDENDIWITMYGDQVARLNGTIQIETHCMPVSFSINKIWGSSGNNLYVVGTKGTIIRYNGTIWARMTSGTEVDIQDIWGITNSSNEVEFILCAVSYVAEPGEHKILRINNVNRIDTIHWVSDRRVHSVWFNSKEKLYACGGGIFFGLAPNYNWIEQTDVPLYFTERVRGNGKNDLFVVGHFGLLTHFNGTTWKTYPEAASALVYTSVDMKNNLMVTVGYTQTKAIIQFMTRN